MNIIDKSENSKETIIISFGTVTRYRIPGDKYSIGVAAAVCLDTRARGKLRKILQEIIQLEFEYISGKIKEPFIKANGKSVSIKTILKENSIIKI